jgi:hypothetical protein
MSAIGMSAMIYSAAIALDLANLYYVKSADQRIADESAIAAAFAFESSGSATTAANAAISLAKANGSGNSTVTMSIVNSPSGDGKQAAYVLITSAVGLSGFGHATTVTAARPAGIPSFTVTAAAYAEIHGAGACIIALQTAGAGFAATGGTRINATSCDVASNSGISLSNGPTLTAPASYAVGTISVTGGSTINGAQYPNSSKQPDPYWPSGDATSPVFSRLSTSFFTNPTAPGFPSMPSAPAGGSTALCNGTLTIAGNSSYGTISTSSYPTCTLINFSGGGTTSMLALALDGPAVTLSFGPGTYKIGSITIQNYGSTTVNLSGSPVLDVYGKVNLESSAPIYFNGTATWNIEGGISDSTSAAVTFSNTDSSSPSTFTVAGGISVTNNAASFPNGTYTITSPCSNGAGIYVSGGSTATLGNGSFDVAGGISIGGGAMLSIGSALDASSVFEIPTVVSGDDAISTGGGSSLSIGSFTNLDINGPMLIEGNIALGGGITTINGTLDMAASGGGSLSASGVALIASGPIAFGQGYNAITLSAPQAITNASEGTQSTVALASSSTTASAITQGATNTSVTGAVYVPSAAMTISGAGNLTGGGGCVQVIASSISVSGGGSVTTNCGSLGNGGGTGSVTLVN